ncbi:hypothetical protein [Streptomyces pacificus]|uniref:Extensin n=1 Tax=Streptomyces pacificus TaxID=2705029 RepID=A0A6A0AVN8_9ACTN|nr:hypothetical protein [Streptomyces pacificus]GFH36014.1 hypothetical protein SCWH03_22360 [Streptomyces pacificus]
MADERDTWLDQESAERLLRGEPLEPVGVDARHQALLLAGLLDEAAARGPVTEPLGGEEAALAAFRQARDGGAAELLPTVRLTPQAGPVSWARSVHWGLAASLAGLAAGGVAVAAGTGLLPIPFGETQPAPASSVSGAVTPGPVATEPPVGRLRSPEAPSPPAGTPSSPSAPAAPDGTRTPDGDGAGARQGEPSTTPHDGRTEDTGDGDWYGRTVQACRDHHNGTLGEERKRTLEAAAQGVDRVQQFCDRILTAAGGDADGSQGGEDGDGDDGGQGGEDGEDGDDGGQGDGDGDDGDDGSGSGGLPRSSFLPPASVRPAPAEQPFAPPTEVWRVSRPAAPGAPLAAL